MKDNWKWIVGIAINFLIMFVLWYGTYSVMQSDVERVKKELEKNNISVMKAQQEHIIEQNNKMEKKLDKIYDIILGN